MRSIEQDLDAREGRRFAAEHRHLRRLEALEKMAESLVGQLCREGKVVYYINLRDRNGRLTGKTRESISEGELIICATDPGVQAGEG